LEKSGLRRANRSSKDQLKPMIEGDGEKKAYRCWFPHRGRNYGAREKRSKKSTCLLVREKEMKKPCLEVRGKCSDEREKKTLQIVPGWLKGEKFQFGCEGKGNKSFWAGEKTRSRVIGQGALTEMI